MDLACTDYGRFAPRLEKLRCKAAGRDAVPLADPMRSIFRLMHLPRYLADKLVERLLPSFAVAHPVELGEDDGLRSLWVEF